MNVAVLPVGRVGSTPPERGQSEAINQDNFDHPTSLALGLSPKDALGTVQFGFTCLETDEPDQLPIALWSIMEFQHWRTFSDHEGRPFESFGVFAAAHEPHGLEARRLERAKFLRWFLLGRDLLELWLEVLESILRRPGRPEKLAPGEYSGPVYRLPTGSNSVDRILLRLKRERGDLLQRVLQRDLTIQHAAVLAGWKKPKPASEVDQTVFCSRGRFRSGVIQDMSAGQKSEMIQQLFDALEPDERSKLLVSLQHGTEPRLVVRPARAEP